MSSPHKVQSMRGIKTLVFSLLLSQLAACGDSVVSAATTQPLAPPGCTTTQPAGHWLAAWGAAPSHAADSFTDQSLRMVISPRFQGSTLRVRLSNRYSSTPVTFSSAWVGKQAEGAALVAGSNQRLRFACADSVTLAAGQEVVSDALALPFAAFENLAISLHVAGSSGEATRHGESLQTSYLATATAGDVTANETGRGFDIATTSTFYLNTIETDAPRSSSAIVTFGDSITDGSVTTDGVTITSDAAVFNRNLRYPDFLARRLSAAGLGGQFSVVNAGIAGNRLISDALIGFPSFGPSGLSRLNADVIAAAGVSDAIILIGTNDLGMAPPATTDQVIAALEQAIERLHAAGINVLLGTQTPSSGVVIPGGHGLPYAVMFRNQINDWIRTQKKADGVIDFHAAVRDPANPDALDPIYDCGDHLHPNPAGYEAMANAIDLSLLRGAR